MESAWRERLVRHEASGLTMAALLVDAGKVVKRSTSCWGGDSPIHRDGPNPQRSAQTCPRPSLASLAGKGEMSDESGQVVE